MSVVSASSQDMPTLGNVEKCAAIDPVRIANTVGLRYVTDATTGISRKRVGKHFSYLGLDGKPIRDTDELQRIKKIGIPPAWTNVWICPTDRGHILATGRDAKGRKQYRYHPRWREVRDETKYDKLFLFGQALPRIRERIAQDLAHSGLSYEKVIATVIRLLDTTLIRVGNEEYVRENGSYGLTTMLDQHVDVGEAKIHFHFKGKGGKEHSIDVKDRQLAKIVKRCQALPGQELFQYIDENGDLHSVESSDVNDYLHQTSGQDFTAKDFRTWGGTVIASFALEQLGTFESETQGKKNVIDAIKSTAERLGNTPSICRKCYVPPGVIDAYLDGSLLNFSSTMMRRAKCNSEKDFPLGNQKCLRSLSICQLNMLMLHETIFTFITLQRASCLLIKHVIVSKIHTIMRWISRVNININRPSNR
jgi:DNA topoisomerase I